MLQPSERRFNYKSVPVIILVGCVASCLFFSVSAHSRFNKRHHPDATAVRFMVKRQDGTLINIGEQKGKIIFLNFWAITCIPCKVEMPTINKLGEHYKNDSTILIFPVDLDNNLPGSVGFMRTNKLDLNVYTAASPIPESLFNGALPTTVIIGKDGEIARYHEGESDYGSTEFFRFMDSLSKVR